MAEESVRSFGPPDPEVQRELALAWRRLGRCATIVACLTSPALFLILLANTSLPWPIVLVICLLMIGAFRGLVDIICHKLIPRPSLYGADDDMAAEDILFRRRRWYWLSTYKKLIWLAIIAFIVLLLAMLFTQWFLGVNTGLFNSLKAFRDTVPPDQRGQYAINFLFNFGTLAGFMVFNIFIFIVPMVVMGVMQMKSFEPGEASWGVKLDDVRGQREPKREVERVITLWQGGTEFREAGGKPERGLLLIGAPGTGKTMLSKAIATSFKAPLMTMPGSGFAQAFIGIDSVIVMILIWRARRLARKWGGNCMIFIDEIDAVGRRRQGLGGGMFGLTDVSAQPLITTGSSRGLEDHLFFGPFGAQTPTGDLIMETPAWREKLFRARDGGAPKARFVLPERIRSFMMPGMGGSMALNQLLVQMDGMDSPPFFRKLVTKRVNTFLDALYFVPQKLGKAKLRMPAAKPRGEQVYFIGATNIDINELDPALIRPGRLGRHIWFRAPNKGDRKDIFDLYLGKVAHDPDLDSDRRRDELSRMTSGYSPAMIEQVCSMALTLAHSDGRGVFEFRDVVEAMTTIEAGAAVDVSYEEDDLRATAIHEAGHAVCSHVYMDDVESTRLSIRQRGATGGHHQVAQTREKFVPWRHEDAADLIWGLGAMAAEHVFYGENSRGVGGDVQMATFRAAVMVGTSGMGPEPVELSHVEFEDDEAREKAEEKLTKRFEKIGLRIMNRTGISAMGDPIAAVLNSPDKRRDAAVLLGQAYLTALCLVRANRDAVAKVADVLLERREIFGDDVLELLDSVDLRAPEIDVTDETIWPKL